MKRHLTALLSGAACLALMPAVQAAPIAPAPALAAQSYADLLEPVPNAAAVLAADDAGPAAQPRLQLVQWHHHHHHHHHGYYRGGGGAFLPGMIIGGALGAIIASQPHYYREPVYDGRTEAWCERHYHSYDPASGTYLGYDGVRHPCP